MQVVVLEGRGGTPSPVLLAPLTGADEVALSMDAGPKAAIGLLRRLARQSDGSPLVIDTLTVSQIDRLLAALYRTLYDDRAECRLRCKGCGEGYEFTLLLSDLIAAQHREAVGSPDADGCWALPDGRRVRAPTLADMAAAAGPEALLARVVVAGDPCREPDAVTDFLERAAPVLSLDLDAACPHCSRREAVRFDLAHYLSARLASERPFLIRETHLIASRYGWSLPEIMALGRADRRAFAGLIEAERTAGQRIARRAG
jgi:hypothetical protein